MKITKLLNAKHHKTKISQNRLRYLRVKLQISQTNKLAKQSKVNLDQATNANLDTNKPNQRAKAVL